MNALRSGTDLVGALLDIAREEIPPHPAPVKSGVRTHQLLLAILGAAPHGRHAVLRELVEAVTHRHSYQHSSEELTPIRGDLRGLLPVAYVAAALLANPDQATRFTHRSVKNYALTPHGWQTLLQAAHDGRALGLPLTVGLAPWHEAASQEQGRSHG